MEEVLPKGVLRTRVIGGGREVLRGSLNIDKSMVYTKQKKLATKGFPTRKRGGFPRS